ncbi:MAG: hypothetical protein R3C49_11855 [Planctomycetaceae bacterium]
MPTTYNGVGTHYYGKKHRQDRQAICQLCGHPATLTSYETRLWFVFFFIPVIPLGRKRITDQCSVCSRHYAIPVKQWETARQVQTAEAMDQFRQSPSEESALAVHGTLTAFQQHDEAAEFRKSMLERFAGRALIRAGFANHLENSGLPKEALTLWEEAHQLDPELPEVRIGLGRHQMRTGHLDEARQLLSFLEAPGAEQQYSLEPLTELTGHLQNKGRHEEALEVMAVLLKAFPHVGTDHQFRKFVRTSEKALQKSESILPEVQHSFSKLFTRQYSSSHRWGLGLTVAAILAVAGLAINNEYIRRHRPLTILNGTGAAIQVQIDDGSPVSVVEKDVISVTEGSHVVRISGEISEEHRIDVTSNYWERWTSTPVWIINAGGAGVIIDMSVHYATSPREPDVRLSADPVFYRQHIDYPFEEPPNEISIGSERSVVTKTTLSWFDPSSRPGGSVSGYLTLKKRNPQQAWGFAVRMLRQHPDDGNLVRFVENDLTDEKRPEFRSLLEEKLEYRPVAVHWHRTYQNLPEVSADYETLISKYDAMLKAEPQNAALLYLRGRIDSDDAEQHRMNLKAIEADPDFPWPEYSLAYESLGRAEWEAALQHVQAAIDKGYPADEINMLRQTALLGLKRYEESESEMRTALATDPGDLSAALLLAELLIDQGKSSEADQPVQQAINSFNTTSGGNFPERVKGTQALLKYFKSDLPGALQETSGSPDLVPVRVMLLAEHGDMDEAVTHSPQPGDVEGRWLPVLFCLGYAAEGNSDAASDWFQKAVTHFESLGPRYKNLTGILKTPASPETAQRVHELSMEPTEKAILVTALAVQTTDTALRKSLLEARRKYLVRHNPPRGLLMKFINFEAF